MLGVKPKEWKVCDWDVFEVMENGDSTTSMLSTVGEILDQSDIPVLAYFGDKDWIVNWVQGEAFTSATEWEGNDDFIAAPYTPFKVDGVEIGSMRQFGNYHFLRMYDSGHMVPMDKPKESLEMFKRFLANDWNLESRLQKRVKLSQVALQRIIEAMF